MARREFLRWYLLDEDVHDRLINILEVEFIDGVLVDMELSFGCGEPGYCKKIDSIGLSYVNLGAASDGKRVLLVEVGGFGFWERECVADEVIDWIAGEIREMKLLHEEHIVEELDHELELFE